MGFTEMVLRSLLRLGSDDPMPPPPSQEEREARRAELRAAARPPPAWPPRVWSVEHAYHPREAAMYGGGYHLVLHVAFHCGRLHRLPGDALCKPQRKFWGLGEGGRLDPHDPTLGGVSCKRCLELAQRLGFDLADPLKAAPGCGSAIATEAQGLLLELFDTSPEPGRLSLEVGDALDPVVMAELVAAGWVTRPGGCWCRNSAGNEAARLRHVAARAAGQDGGARPTGTA